MKNVALFFGSFNPMHKGHLHIGEKTLDELDHIDEVWYVVSPQNPHKSKTDLLDEKIRLEMVSNSISHNPNLKLCDIELELDKPSYTYKTLYHLEKRVGKFYNFSIIMGSDVINNIESWDNYEKVIRYPIISFVRGGEKVIIPENVTNITLKSNIELSSTYIRNKIKSGEIEELDGLIDNEVLDFIIRNKHYTL